jgi:exopolysaccharide production protein ExoQ
MPPPLALLLTVGFIAFLFWRDSRQQQNVTRALWIPLFWMLIIASRFVSQWLTLFGFSSGAVTLEEGSSVDAIVFFSLIASGLYVLRSRQVSLSEVIRNNGWLTVFFVYCFVSILWSDFPFVAFKRWVKIAGHPIMVLILFTEPDPEAAIRTVIKRCAFVLVPVSILFIKYYPEWGRGFDDWGMAVNVGVTTNKNELGWLCFVLGLFFFWNLLQAWRIENPRSRWELFLSFGFLGMIWWLLTMAHSATSLVSLSIGALVVLFVGFRLVDKQFIGTYVLTAIILCVAAELVFGASDQIVSALGKDPTLSDRTEVWQDVLKVPINPFLGAGFETFWLGERREKLWEKWWWHPNEAHNGYLEVYLNLGLVGLTILAGLLIGTFWKIRRQLSTNMEWGRLRLGFLLAVIVFNWTEATFKALHPVWFAFYIIAVDYPSMTVLRSNEDEDLRDQCSRKEEFELYPGWSVGFRRTRILSA